MPCQYVEGTDIDEVYEAGSRPFAERLFGCTMGLTDFWCVNVGNTDLDAIAPKRVAVHDAIDPCAGPALMVFRLHDIGSGRTSSEEYDTKWYE